jgi:hypothetical protein
MLMVFMIAFSLSAIHSTIPVHAVTHPVILSIDPSSQPLLSPGSTVTINVNVSNISPSDTLNGWNIYVRTNSSALMPVDFTIGSYIGSSITETTHCVNNVGLGCDHYDAQPYPFTMVHSLANTFGTGGSGNGTLFTITYKAVAGPYSLVTFFQPGSSTQLFDSNGFSTSFTSVFGTYGNVPTNFPVASFTWTPQLPFENEKVVFNASSSTTPTGKIDDPLGYSWTFSSESLPQTQSTGKITSNIFLAANWTVTLVVTNDQGVSSLPATGTVHVSGRPSRDLAVCTSSRLDKTCSPTISASQVDYIHPGDIITIKVNVVNLGTTNEIGFNMSVSVAGKVFRPPPYPNVLLPNHQAPYTFQWNTTGLSPDSYTIHAHVDILLNEKGQINETNIANNDAYYTVRLIYPLRDTLLPFDMFQFGGLVVLSLFIVSLIVYYLRRGQRRKLLAQQELL